MEEHRTYDVDTTIPGNSNDCVKRTKVHSNDAHFAGAYGLCKATTDALLVYKYNSRNEM